MSRSGPVGVGFIGTVVISDTYLEDLTRCRDVKVMTSSPTPGSRSL